MNVKYKKCKLCRNNRRNAPINGVTWTVGVKQMLVEINNQLMCQHL
jgi:type VI protein secretion system component VasK